MKKEKERSVLLTPDEVAEMLRVARKRVVCREGQASACTGGLRLSAGDSLGAA